MSRAVIDADTIAELRGLVIGHNERGQGQPTRLQELKKVYTRGWWGPDPRSTALGRVNRHLAKLAKASDFEEHEHRRDSSGKFTSGGGGGGGKPPKPPKGPPSGGREHAFRDVAQPERNRALKDKNDGYRGSQTQVIAENRYSLYGGAAGAALGVAAGAARGAMPRAARAADKLVHGAAGRLVGATANIASRPFIGAAGALRDRISKVPAAQRAAINSARAKATGRAASKATEATLRGAAYLADTPNRLYDRAARKQITDLGAKGARKMGLHAKRVVAGAGIGALAPGLAYAYTGNEAGKALGPYLDASYPRRVEKLAKALQVPADPRSEAVLAKYRKPEPAHGWYSPGLAKVAADPRSREILAKASLSGLGQRVKGFGASAWGKIRAPKAMAAPVAAATRARTPPPPASGANRANRWARQARIGGFGTAAVSLGGAVVGGGLGAAGAAGAERVYYRDEDGKFTSQSKAVATGAGAAAGALAGASFIRGKNSQFIRQAAEQAASGRSFSVPKADGSGPVTLKPAEVAARAKQIAEDRIRKQKDPVIKAAKTKAEAATQQMRLAAANGAVGWNDWQVRRALHTKVRGLLNEPVPGAKGFDKSTHAFWGKASADTKKAVLKLQAKGMPFDHLLTQPQQTQLAALATQATGSQRAYARAVKDFNDKLDGFKAVRAAAVKDHDAAKLEFEAHRAARQAPDTPDIDKPDLALKENNARDRMDAAAKLRDQAQLEVSAYEHARANPRTTSGVNVVFPQPRDPFGTGLKQAMPSPAEIDKIEKEMTSEALEAVEELITKEGTRVQGIAQGIAADAASRLRGLSAKQRDVVGDTLGQMAGHMAPHLRRAQRDIRRAGGAVSEAVNRKFGAVPGRMVGYAARANERAMTWALGAKDATTGKRTGGRLTQGWNARAKIIGTGLAAGSTLGLVDYYEDGTFDLQVRTPKEIWNRMRKNPPKGVQRVFHPGDPQRQAILTGVVVRDKKTGQTMFLEGSIRRGTDGKAPAEEVPLNARLSDVIQRLNNQNTGGYQQGQRPTIPNVDQGMARGWNDALKAVRNAGKIGTFGEDDLSIEYRTDDGMHGEAAGQIKATLFKEAAKKGGNFGGGFQPGDYYAQLGAILDADQSALLTLTQRNNLLLGGSKDGEKGLFSPAVRAAWTNSGQPGGLFTALKNELTKGKVPYVNPGQEHLLRKAVRVLNERAPGPQKMGDDQLAELDQLIDSNRKGGQRPAGGGAGAAAPPPRAERLTTDERRSMKKEDLIKEMRARYDPGLPEQRAAYENVPDLVEAHWAAKEEQIAKAPANRTLSEEERFDLVVEDIRRTMNRTSKPRATKSHDAGDLRKFDETRYSRKPKGDDSGGEFAPKGTGRSGGGDSTLARDQRDKPRPERKPRAASAREAVERTTPVPEPDVNPPRQPPDQRGFYEPVRLGAALGGAVGGEAGWAAAERYLPGRLRTAGTVARLAWRIGAASAGGLAGGVVGEKGGSATYRLAGKEAPGAYEAPDRSLPETAARIGGTIAGSMLSALPGGGVVRSVAAASVGQIHGEELAGRAEQAVASRYGDQIAASVRRALPAPVAAAVVPPPAAPDMPAPAPGTAADEELHPPGEAAVQTAGTIGAKFVGGIEGRTPVSRAAVAVLGELPADEMATQVYEAIYRRFGSETAERAQRALGVSGGGAA